MSYIDSIPLDAHRTPDQVGALFFAPGPKNAFFQRGANGLTPDELREFSLSWEEEYTPYGCFSCRGIGTLGRGSEIHG